MEDQIPFNRTGIAVATLVVATLSVVAGIASFISKNDYVQYLPYVFFPVLILGMKFSASRIPTLEVVFAVLVILTVNGLIGLMFPDSIFLWYVLGTYGIPFLCCAVFGFRWVQRRYIPAGANSWN